MLVAGFDRQITERDDADKPHLPIEDDQAADLLLPHQLGRFLDILVVEAVGNVGRQKLPKIPTTGWSFASEGRAF